MAHADHLLSQASKCRRLAIGLSNRDDVRTLEQLAAEFEDKARAAARNIAGRPEVAH